MNSRRRRKRRGGGWSQGAAGEEKKSVKERGESLWRRNKKTFESQINLPLTAHGCTQLCPPRVGSASFTV